MVEIYNYVGKYRVVCEFCRQKLKPCKEDTYILCANKGQIYRYSNNVLCYYREARVNINRALELLDNNGVEVLNSVKGPGEMEIYFYEKDIEKVARLFKAMVKGKDIKPTSKRNLKLFDWYIPRNKKAEEIAI